MKELDDYDLGSEGRPGEPKTDEAVGTSEAASDPQRDVTAGDSYIGEEPSHDRRRLIIGVAILLVVVIAVLVWLWRRAEVTAPAPVVAEAQTPADATAGEPTATRTTEEDLELPSLDLSDTLIRELAAALSAHPEFASWLVNEDLVRRLVVSVDNLAEGESPKSNVGFLAPGSSFRVMKRDGKTFINPASYRRYDTIVEVFTSLDSAGSVDLYRRLKPLTDEAYRELGYPQRDFEDTLRRAAREILETPVPGSAMEVEAAVRSYRYADARFEELSSAQKQLLRFGPENLTRIQAKVRAFVAELDRVSAAESG